MAVDLKALALRKVRSSGLEAKMLKTLHLSTMTGAQIKALEVGLPAYGALKLPYFDVQGKPTRFFRLRYLEDVPAKSGSTKLLRYVQLPGSLNEVYLPPLLPWRKIFTDPDTALVITEGELKAACACVRGIPTVGLGGVWSFGSSVRQLPLLPQLTQIKWEGRTVYVCYDSDASTNADVSAAIAMLSRELLGRGALPKVVTLPHLRGTHKTGLDDYLVAKGAKAFGTLLAEATPFATSAALYELNSEVVYIRDPGLVVVLKDNQRLRPKDFVTHAYANRYYHEAKLLRDGTEKLEKKPAAHAWLGWERRSELQRLTYRPGASRLVHDELNLWRGWGCEPKRGDVRPWTSLLDILFRDASTMRRYVEQWLAYPLQHPGTKLFTAIALWGRTQGTGKSLLGYTMKRIYGDSNFVEIRDKELADGRNEWAQNKQFVMGDELFSGDAATTPAMKRAMGDRLKSMITQESIRIDAKYIPSFYTPDCLNYYLNSNHMDMLFVEDQDRRYAVHEVRSEPQSKAFYDEYTRWMRSAEGPAALFYYLLHLKLDGFDPSAPALMTVSKSLMIEASLSDLGVWVRRLRDDADSVLRLGQSKLDGDLWTNAELLRVFDPEGRSRVSANGLGRELTNAGIQHACLGAPLRTETRGLVRLYAVRNAKLWVGASSRQAAAHYDKTRGLGLKKTTARAKVSGKKE